MSKKRARRQRQKFFFLLSLIALYVELLTLYNHPKYIFFFSSLVAVRTRRRWTRSEASIRGSDAEIRRSEVSRGGKSSR